MVSARFFSTSSHLRNLQDTGAELALACELNFKTCGTTTAGFKVLQKEKNKSELRFPVVEEVVEALESLKGPIELHEVTIRIPYLQGDGEVRSEIVKMTSHLPGGDGYLPKAFGARPWHMFADDKNIIDLKHDRMASRLGLLHGGHSMQPLPAETTFTSVDEVKVKLVRVSAKLNVCLLTK